MEIRLLEIPMILIFTKETLMVFAENVFAIPFASKENESRVVECDYSFVH